MGCLDGFGFVDKATYPARRFAVADGVRVVPGSPNRNEGQGRRVGLSIAAPVIVKYRDEKTELSLVLEDVLR
jgi:2,3,4,5-tetrahydropyridine-2-carboxylate N-succinyltransferase